MNKGSKHDVKNQNIKYQTRKNNLDSDVYDKVQK